jgi:hypothetical protein
VKIVVDHAARGCSVFKSGDILRQKKTGQLFILTQQHGGYNVWSSLHLDITSKKIMPSSNQKAQFDADTYELFRGTITLSNEA